MNANVAPAPQLTARAIILAIVLAVILAAANTYLGLFAGMTIASAIPAAVVSMAVLRALGGGGILENNIVQTGASAGTSIASGVIFTVPALVLMGYWPDFKYWWVLAIAGLGGLLGVLFSVPLRRSLIVDQQMTFPEGKAAAEVLRAGENPSEGVKVLGIAALVGGDRQADRRQRPAPHSRQRARQRLHRQVSRLHGHEHLARVARRRLHRRAQHRRCRGVRAACCRSTSRFRSITRTSCRENPELAATVAGACQGLSQRGMRGSHGADPARRADPLSRRRRDAGRRPVGADHAAQFHRVGRQERPRRGARRQRCALIAHTDRDLPMKWVLIGIVLFTIPLGGSLLPASSAASASALAMSVIMIVAGFLFCSVSAYMAGLVGSSNNPVSGITIATILFAALVLLASSARTRRSARWPRS